jgi:signal transduction histidine kinase
LGLLAKLNVAVFTVIIVTVVTHAAFQLFGERNAASNAAKLVASTATMELQKETEAIEKHNRLLADKLVLDPAFIQAYSSKDRGTLSTAVQSFQARNGFSGSITVVDKDAKVFWSSDSPSKFGYSVMDANKEISDILHRGIFWHEAAQLTATGEMGIGDLVPIRIGGNVSGVLAVLEPVNSEFLAGLKRKVELTTDVGKVDFLFFSPRDRHVTMTPELMGSNGGFAQALQSGNNNNFRQAIEQGGRLWYPYPYTDAANRVIGIAYAAAIMPATQAKIAAIMGQAAISAFAALILGICMSVAISGKQNKNIKFLVARATALAAQKRDLPSLEGLGQEWMELADVIDTAVASPRSSVKSLQNQMGKHQDELAEKEKQIEIANSQVEAVNRQLMVQNRQLSEVSKQINAATSQSILLQQKLAALMQVSTEGFLILDPFGNVMNANPTFLNWAGCVEGEVAGRYCFDFVRKPGDPREGNNGNGNGDSAFALHNPSDLIANFYPEGVIYHRKEDRLVEVLTHLQPVMTDEQNIQGYVMVMRDKSLHSEASRLRGEMVAMLQESIRTPLTSAEQKWSAVNAYTQQLMNSTLNNQLTDVHMTYQQLLGVVDSLLMVYGGIVPSAPVVREQLSITRLIGDCLEQVAQQARVHQIMLDYKTVTGLPTTAVDKQIVRDVVIQLMEKMISVTAPGGRVRVESAAKGNEIRISIFSSGPALGAEEIEEMFAGFVQGKHPEESYSSRLSLYLVRNNIERIGGRVWAESDRGTYIYFLLPVQA